MGWAAIHNNTSIALNNHMAKLTDLQAQAASGKSLLRASANPPRAYRILSLRSTGNSMEAYGNNLAGVDMSLSQASTILQKISDALTRVNVLLEQAASETYSAANRESMAIEIDSVLEEVTSMANHRHMDKYLFGGTDIAQSPYEVTRTNGLITAVEYRGSQSDMQVPVAPGVKQPGLMVGDRFFRNNERLAPVFLGNTGATTGTGTSSVRGDQWLEVRHTTTVVNAPDQGLAAGASSPLNDTFIGTGTINIDEPAGTIRFGSGQTVATGSADTKLTNANGDVVYLDSSSITPGFVGAVTITSNGTLSVNGGTDTVAIDFSNNQAVTDSTTGRILYVNSGNITRVGDEPLRVPGTYDMFGMLMATRDALSNTRGVSPTLQNDMLTNMLNSLEEVRSGISQQMTSVGSRIVALDNLKESMDNIAFNAKTEASGLQDADIVQIATDIAQTQTLYEMTLASAAKLLNMSLLDYIR